MTSTEVNPLKYEFDTNKYYYCNFYFNSLKKVDKSIIYDIPKHPGPPPKLIRNWKPANRNIVFVSKL
jgi:hypothetical protein